MGWSIGYDTFWERDIGYGVPSICDHPECDEEIDRGLGYVCCQQEPCGGANGCGLYFCEAHSGGTGMCERCEEGEPPFDPSPDTDEWINHKLTDKSWQQWRNENPGFVIEHTNTPRS